MGRVHLIEPVIGLYAFSLFMIYPLLQQYVYRRLWFQLNGTPYPADSLSHCSNNHSNASIHQYKRRCLFSSSKLNFSSSSPVSYPLFSWSHVVTTTGVKWPSLSYVIVSRFSFSLKYLLAASFLSGLMGGTTSLIRGCFAYVADLCGEDPEGRKTVRMARVDMILGVLSGLASLCTGFYIKAAGFTWPFLTVVLLHLLNLFYVLVVLKESQVLSSPSLSASNPAPEVPRLHWCDALSTRLQGVYLLFAASTRRRNIALLLMLAAFAFYKFSIQGGMSIFTLYELNTPLCWSEVLVGFGSGLSTAIFMVSFVGVTLLSRCLHDVYIFLLGLMSVAASLIMAAFAKTTLLMFLVRLPLLLSIMPTPVLRSMMSKMVPGSEQGGGAIASLLERARCYGLLGQWKTAIFDYTTILKEHPDHVQALCGRGFTYLLLNQQKECTQDILVALQSDAEEVTRRMLSLKDKSRRLISEWLGQRCRSSLSEILLANPVPCREEHLREAFVIGGALMNSDCREPKWHLLYIDTLLAKGEVNAAGAHLKQVFGQEPRDVTAKARWGVVKAWQQNYKLAASYLSEVAEKEPATLDFLVSLMQFSQRKRVAQVASQQASSVSQSGQWEHALALLTLAVRAVNDKKLRYLRQRAACLAHLGLHERAVSDLNNVIKGHSDDSGEEYRVWTEDFCRRGRSLLLCSFEESGLQDFSHALDLHEEQALLCLDAGPGRQRLAELFLRFALQHYGKQQMDKAWLLTETGLKVESDNAELRRLRARIKRDVSGPCTVH